MIRDLVSVSYVPLLSLRPSEMAALQELPERDKSLLLPVIRLRPWLSALSLHSAVTRLEDAYGKRPCYITLCEPEIVETRREVHETLDSFRDSRDGFASWCTFFEQPEHSQFIPTLQLSDVNQFDAQTERLEALGRGLLVVIDNPAFQFIPQITRRTARLTAGGRDVLFILDFGRQNRSLLLQQLTASNLVGSVLENCPEARVSLSASSFPEVFTTINVQDIYERLLFDDVQSRIGRMIYSDRGSARAERQLGGGGAPAPRVDFAQARSWSFFREDASSDRIQGYRNQATRLIRDFSVWDPNLRLWGTQMIERTALGDTSAISNPARSTAVRINIHLHQQLFYGNPDGLYHTDEEWSD